MKKFLFLIPIFSLFLVFIFKSIRAQGLPSQISTPYPLPYGYPETYGYPLNPYYPSYEIPGYGRNQSQVFDYTNPEVILQKRAYFLSLLGKNTNFSPSQSSYFFLIGQFSVLLPYLLFSLPQPQVSVFTLASIFLMYP